MFAGAFVLRLPGLWTDLWLDELWSLQNVRAAGHWWDLFLGTRIDNNHHLNSLYLYLVGPDASPVVYRLLAFVSGIGVVATAWVIGARESRLAAVVAAVLFGSSYLMVFYASEARGYATVVWLTLAAWYCIQQYADTPRAVWAVGFAACSIAGVMAHQTYMMFFVGAYVWFEAHQSTRRTLRMATAARGTPVPRAGGRSSPSTTSSRCAGRTLAVVLPIGSSRLPRRRCPLSAADHRRVRVCGSLVRSSPSSSHCQYGAPAGWETIAGCCTTATGLVIPAVVTIARQPPTLPPRYFIVPASVLLLAASVWISRRIAQGGAAAVGAAMLVAAHVTGGVLQATGEAASRGHYRDALEQIVASSTGSPITVASSDRYRRPRCPDGPGRRVLQADISWWRARPVCHRRGAIRPGVSTG